MAYISSSVHLITNHNNQHEQEKEEKQFDKQQIVRSSTSTKTHTQDKASDIDKDTTLESSKEWGCTKYDPPCTDSGQSHNKDFAIKNSISKNIDYIDADHLNFNNLSINHSASTFKALPKTENTEINHKEEFFEDKLCLSSSKSYNNYSCLNDACKSKNISEHKKLRYFYPLSEKDISTLAI